MAQAAVSAGEVKAHRSRECFRDQKITFYLIFKKIISIAFFFPQAMRICVTFLKGFQAPEVHDTCSENCDLVWSCTDTWTPQGGFHSLLAHPLCGGSARLTLQWWLFFQPAHPLAGLSCHVTFLVQLFPCFSQQ